MDDKRDSYGMSCRWRLVGFRNTCHDTRTGAFSSGSVSPSTYKLFEGRDAWWRFAELSGRPSSLVYRVPVIAQNQRRTHQFTLPGRTSSEFTAPRGDRDIFVSIQALGCSDCHPREYLPASQRQAHLHATCTAGRTRRGTEAGPRRRGFFDHEPTPARMPPMGLGLGG